MGDAVTIHANPSLKHQREFAQYLKSGFDKHHQPSLITDDPRAQGDIHVVLGPHFAKQHWLGHRTILLDRGWWGDPAGDVSLSWMTADGGHTITDDCPDDRDKPELKALRALDERCLILLDYGMATEGKRLQEVVEGRQITTRYHPADCDNGRTLDEDLARHTLAIGKETTALVAAAIAGLRVLCFSEKNPVYPVSIRDLGGIANPPDRRQWLNNLSYHQYKGSEIASGLAWEFLCQSLK